MNVHDIVAGAVTRAQQGALRSAQAYGSGFDFGEEQEKTASFDASSDGTSDDHSEYREKLASALDDLADMFKEAKHQGVGGGHKAKAVLGGKVSGKTHFVSPGRGKPTQSPLQPTKGGKGRTAIKTASVEDMRDRIKQKLANMNGDDANITQTPLRAPGGESFGGTGPGVHAAGTDLISSNERAMNFKPREAQAVALANIRAYLAGAANNKMNDPLLRSSFEKQASRDFGGRDRSSREEKKTYPISRFLTSPGARAIYGGGVGALVGSNHGPHGALTGGLVGAGAGALSTLITREINNRAMRGRINMGGDALSDSEMDTLEAATRQMKGKHGSLDSKSFQNASMPGVKIAGLSIKDQLRNVLGVR